MRKQNHPIKASFLYPGTNMIRVVKFCLLREVTQGSAIAIKPVLINPDQDQPNNLMNKLNFWLVRDKGPGEGCFPKDMRGRMLGAAGSSGWVQLGTVERQ